MTVQPSNERARQRTAHRIIARDVPCLNCGYNLRGLAEIGQCPECGSSIRRSLEGFFLAFSAPEYVGDLRRGVNCILIAALLLLIGIGPTVLIGMAADFASIALSALYRLWIFAVAGLLLIGGWLFSAQDHAIAGYDAGDLPRQILRISIIASATLALVHVLLEYVFFASRIAFDYGWLVRVAMMLVLTISFLTSLAYIQWIAQRIPSDDISRRAGRHMWLLPIISVAGFCIFLFGPLIALSLYLTLLLDLRLQFASIERMQKQASILCDSPPDR